MTYFSGRTNWRASEEPGGGMWLLWLGILIVGAGWLLLLFGAGQATPGIRQLGIEAGEVVNLHRLVIALAAIVTGCAMAVVGAIYEAVLQLKPHTRRKRLPQAVAPQPAPLPAEKAWRRDADRDSRAT